MWKFLIVVTLLLFASAVRAADAPTTAPSRNVGGVEETKETGSISGVVLFTGNKPEAKPISEVAGNAFCKEHHKEKLPERDTFLFGKNGEKETLQNVLVYVSKGLEDQTFEVPITPTVLDQVGCIYTPHVVAVMVGQTLEVRNSDATLHNVMSSPRDNPSFNFGMPVKGGKNNLTFKYAEKKINTKCFMHPWMSAYVHVLENPFFAMTGEDGTFTITGLPSGEYELSVLHESSAVEATPESATVTVVEGEKQDVEFTYQMKADQ